MQEQPAQKISSLPPLKLPVNIQSEQRLDNTENKSTNGKDNDADKISEKSQNNDAEANSSENANNSNLVNGPSAKDEDNVSHQESSEAAPSETPKRTIVESQPAGHEDQAKAEGNEQDDKNNESGENDKESDKIQESNENTENQATQETEEPHTEVAETTTTDEIEQETSTHITPPPKPPRLKSGNVEDTSNEKRASKGSDEVEEIGKEENGEETKANDERIGSAKSSDGRTKSAISKTGDEDMVDAIENSIDKVEEDGHAEESKKAEVDGTQDDVDVVQSPAPRTSKFVIFAVKMGDIEKKTNEPNLANIEKIMDRIL